MGLVAKRKNNRNAKMVIYFVNWQSNKNGKYPKNCTCIHLVEDKSFLSDKILNFESQLLSST